MLLNENGRKREKLALQIEKFQSQTTCSRTYLLFKNATKFMDAQRRICCKEGTIKKAVNELTMVSQIKNAEVVVNQNCKYKNL